MFGLRKKSNLKRFFNRQLIDQSLELNSSDHQNEPPIFSAPMQVDQVYTGHYPFWKVALHLLLGFVPGLLALCLVKGKSDSMLVLVFWMLSTLIAIGLLSFRQVDHQQRETEKLFHGETQVTLKGNGIKINHVGQASWQEIFSLDSVGKIDQQICLSILNLGKFQLKISPENFEQLAAPYFAHNRRIAWENSNSAEGALPFKGFFFHALPFYIFSLLGCLTGVTTFIFSLIDSKFSFSSLPIIILISFITSLIFWSPLGWRIGHLQTKKTKLFELEGFALRSSDGKTFNLRDSKITAHRKFAVPFKLTYLSIYPKAGGHLDLWIEASELKLVIHKLNKIGFELKLPK